MRRPATGVTHPSPCYAPPLSLGGRWLGLEDGRVDRASSISSGVEDYYLDGSEPLGVWLGAAAPGLDARGVVEPTTFRRILDGLRPTTGEPLGRHAATRVPGFDLTFSAPKSVSVLFGIGDQHVEAAIRRAHEVAVRDAFGYLERHAAVARRGAGGRIAVQGRGLVAASFRHRASRAGDPQLHTHVVVANLVQAEDGRWSAVDGRRLYAHAKTAGYLYEARLRSELTRDLGLEWTAVKNGIADVAGVPSDVLKAFSRRRAQIDAELERSGERGPRAAQMAALETRRRKDHLVSRERLEHEWRERAATLGFDSVTARQLLHPMRTRRLDGEVLEHAHDVLAGDRGLTRRRSTFTRRDAIQGWCERLPPEVPVDVATIERIADHFLSTPDVVSLAIGEAARTRDAVLKRRDGRIVRALPDERHYSTAGLLRIEQMLIDRAVQGRGRGVGLARPEAVARALAARETIAGEQAEMVQRLTADGDRVAIVIGSAGTGKTYALAAAREAWESSGVPVVGAAIAWRAARGLEDGAGIPSTSVASLLERCKRQPLLRRAVLVVDEAGMVPTRDMAVLLRAVERAGGKLVLVGDDRQLPEIDAGGVLRGLRTRLDVIELRENRRQVEPWEREALELLRDGHGGRALDQYTEHGRVRTGDGETVGEQLIADWAAARRPWESLILAYRRDDVAELNRRARDVLLEQGWIRGPEVRLGNDRYAAGDLVVLRRNDRRLGVANGDRGFVVAVDSRAGTIDVLTNRVDVRLSRDYLERPDGPALQHGYAMTGHVAQGATVERTFVLASEEAGREWLYTALSRGRLENRAYGAASRTLDRDDFAPAEPREAADVLEHAVTRSRAHVLAIDRARQHDRGIER